MKGIQQRRTYYGSVDDTIISIEADESTPLLMDRIIWPDECSYKSNSTTKTLTLKYSLSSWSFHSSNQSTGSNYNAASTKSFKSHFKESKVLAFALFIVVAISVAIYLLVIESCLPSITLSLDLVNHDIWSRKIIPKCKHLQYHNVDHIIIMQTGNRSCDTSIECLEVLTEMQSEDPMELPYNFLIGGDGQAYEVRGWKYSSTIGGIPQERSLVIGIIGNFEQSTTQNLILLTVKSLIRESSKRRMINRKYYIYGLLQHDHGQAGAQTLFREIKEWPNFKGFLTHF